MSNIAFNQCGGVLFSVSMAISGYFQEENLGSDQLRIFLERRSARILFSCRLGLTRASYEEQSSSDISEILPTRRLQP